MEKTLGDIITEDLSKQIETLRSNPRAWHLCGCCGHNYPGDEIFPDNEYGNICEGCLREKEE